MKGDHKVILNGQILETKIRAQSSFLASSVTNQELNKAFIDKTTELVEEYKKLINEKVDNGKEKEKIKSFIERAEKLKEESVLDLATIVKNLKTALNDLYQDGVKNHWATVTKVSNLMISDLEAVPLDNAQKAMIAINAKIQRLTQVVTNASISQSAKFYLLKQFAKLKDLTTQYLSSYEKIKKIKDEREKFYQDFLNEVHKFNESQSKAVIQITEGSEHDFIKAVLGSSLALLIGIGLLVFFGKKYIRNLISRFDFASQTLSNWISLSGEPKVYSIEKPKDLEFELYNFYETLDSVIKKVNQFRKEDVAFKKASLIPTIVVSRSQLKAVYWNSPFAILSKNKSIEEAGHVSYSMLVRFFDLSGNQVDPIERCFLERKEVQILTLLRSGNENIAVQVSCIPVSSENNNEVDYCVVFIKDLRDENQRIENEIDRQLEPVREASRSIVKGEIPRVAPSWARKIIQEAILNLVNYAKSKHERKRAISAQLNEVWSKIDKEKGLKEALTQKLIDLSNDVETVQNQINELNEKMNVVCNKLINTGEIGVEILSEYKNISEASLDFAENIKQSRKILRECISFVIQAERLTDEVKNSSKAIDSLVQKVNVLNVNNNLLETRYSLGHKSLTPQELMTITDNLNEILTEFQRAYRLITDSVFSLYTGLNDLTSKIKKQLLLSSQALEKDKVVFDMIDESGRKIYENKNELSQIVEELKTLMQKSLELNQVASNLNSKASKLTEIGKISLELQSHLSNGLKTTTDFISSDAVSL
jgi:hypothetical protein